MTKASCVLFLLVVLSALSFAQQSTGEKAFADVLPSWFPIIAISLFLGYGLAAVAYMASTVFRTPELNVWAKMEVAEVTASAFLVLIILIALNMSDAVFLAATQTTPMQASLDFTKDASNTLFGVYLDSVWLSAAVGTLTGVPPQYGGTGGSEAAKKLSDKSPDKSGQPEKKSPGGALRMTIMAIYMMNVNYNPFWSGGTFLGHFGTIQSLSLTSVLISVVSHLFLDFVQKVAIPVLIPFGLFLSVFSITRKLGRTLMAFGIGLYLFLPASVLIAKGMYDSAYKNPAYTPTIPEIPKPSEVSSLTASLLTLQAAQIVLSTVGVIVIGPTMTAGWPAFAIPCAIGALLRAIIDAFTCTVAAGACVPGFFAAHFAICFTATAPVTELPPSHDFTVAIFSSMVSMLKITGLDSILGAGVPGALQAASALPMIPAALGLYDVMQWHALFPDLTFPGLPGISLALAISQPIASFLAFLSHIWLETAFADKLTDITLDYTPYVLQYAVPIMLIPIIMLLVVVTGIRSISPVIGGEVQILGVSELI